MNRERTAKPFLYINGQKYCYAGVDYKTFDKNPKPEVIYTRKDGRWTIDARILMTDCEEEKVFENEAY